MIRRIVPLAFIIVRGPPDDHRAVTSRQAAGAFYNEPDGKDVRGDDRAAATIGKPGAGLRRLLFLVAIAGLGACRGAPTEPAVDPTSDVLPSGTGWFTDVTIERGLLFEHESGAAGSLHLPEIMGGGVALIDLDHDGDLDIYLTNGNDSLAPNSPAAPPSNRLFLQGPDGRFVDATSDSGLGDTGYGLGVAVGDVDNDGDRDLYLANLGRDRLYLNHGDGRFEEAGPDRGVEVDGFSSSAVFCDYDRDGWLDLYVVRYVRYQPRQVCRDSTGRPDYCNPKAFTPAGDVLLHNEGGGRFRDVSGGAGPGSIAAAGLGVVCEDLDGDGWPDFYVANDGYANQLWANSGDGTFKDRAVMAGAAYNLEGRAEAGMGVVAADLDDDSDLDLFMTHLPRESNTYYRNLGGGLFEDATGPAGMAQSSLPYTGFGTAAFDVELDGDLDLVVANGRVLRADNGPAQPADDPFVAYAERNLLFLNRGGARFALAPDAGLEFTAPAEVSRGLAVGDLDGDGDVDLLVGNVQAGPRLYLNQAPRAGHWLTVRAVDPRHRRDALGARVKLIGDDWSRVRTISGGFSYLSCSEPVAHFGIDRGSPPLALELEWLDGLVERFKIPGLDREIEVVRGRGGTQP